MTQTLSFRNIAVALLLAVAPASVAFAAPDGRLPTEEPTVRVTLEDVNASNEKIRMAYGALATMWTKEFRAAGARFDVPRIARYQHTIMTSCGVIHANNAEYCPEANTIFYDEVFVAGMAKRAAISLGTDGDMAAVGIIAHEMGHAVAIQLGHESRSSYQNESTADCLAGAFALQSQRDGNLEKGDIEEAFYGMSLAGDPTPEPTGNERVDAMIASRIARQSHGTKDQRMENFRDGLTGGPSACLAELGHAS
jgi:predicted metalloprotease